MRAHQSHLSTNFSFWKSSQHLCPKPMLHLLAKWNQSVSKETRVSRKEILLLENADKKISLRGFFTWSKREKARKEAYAGLSTRSRGIVISGHLSMKDDSMTSGYKCAKLSVCLSFLRSKFPQCHRCAFLKQTIIITVITGSSYILISFTYFAHSPRPFPPGIRERLLSVWFVCFKQTIIFTVSDKRWFLIWGIRFLLLKYIFLFESQNLFNHFWTGYCKECLLCIARGNILIVTIFIVCLFILLNRINNLPKK